MVVVATILVSEQHFDEAWIDVGARRLQPPTPLGRGEGPKQLPVCIEQLHRYGVLGGNRRRIRLVERIEPPKRTRRHEDGEAGSCRDIPPAGHQGAALTSMRPVAVRAEYSGRYMSSTCAAGWA